MPFDRVPLRAVPMGPWAKTADPAPLSGFEFSFWACSRDDPAYDGTVEVDCRGVFDDHLLRVSSVRGWHDGRNPSIQAAIVYQTQLRDAMLRVKDERPQPWQKFCDELVRIFIWGHRQDRVNTEIIWRCSQGRHRSLGMAVAAAGVLRYFGASVRVFAGRGRLCKCQDCCSFHDVRVNTDIFALVDLLMGVQLAASIARMQREGVWLSFETHSFLSNLIEDADTVWEEV